MSTPTTMKIADIQSKIDAKRERQIIAGTIRVQTGAYAFMMQGGREYYHGEFTVAGLRPMPGLRFTAKPKARLVHVFILLDPSDTYHVVVMTRRTAKAEAKVLKTWEGVYADSLTDLILNLDKAL